MDTNTARGFCCLFWGQSFPQTDTALRVRDATTTSLAGTVAVTADTVPALGRATVPTTGTASGGVVEGKKKKREEEEVGAVDEWTTKVVTARGNPRGRGGTIGRGGMTIGTTITDVRLLVTITATTAADRICVEAVDAVVDAVVDTAAVAAGEEEGRTRLSKVGGARRLLGRYPFRNASALVRPGTFPRPVTSNSLPNRQR
jgi:hypothetical protein